MGWVFDTDAEKNLKRAIKAIKGFRAVEQELDDIDDLLNYKAESNTAHIAKTEALAKKFFASIHQMQSVIDANPEFWNGFVQKAADVINSPDSENSKKDLYGHLNRLESEWGDLKEYSFTPKRTAAFHTAGFFAGAGISVGGGAMVYGIAAGTLALATGPWGIAVVVIAVAIILVGLIIAACEAYLAYKHSRVAMNSQMKEILAFVKHIAGDDGFGKEIAGEVGPHIINNYAHPRLSELPPQSQFESGQDDSQRLQMT